MTSSNGKPASSPTPDACEVCGARGRERQCNGTGYFYRDVPPGDPNFGKLFRCELNPLAQDPDRRATLRRLSNLDAFANMQFDVFETDIGHLGSGEQDRLRRALRAARDYAETLGTRGDAPWLLLEGTYGTGKTHLAAAIGHARLMTGNTVLFITAPDLLDHLRGSYGAEAEESYNSLFDRVRDVELLLLDDLGVENPSPWAQEKLFQLLNHRYARRLPTVITTNNSLDRFEPRLRSRLADNNLVQHIKLDVPDYRDPFASLRRDDALSELPRYGQYTFDAFDTSSPDATEQMNLQKALEVARNFARRPAHNWLMLMGDSGTGKTHLAAAIANEQHAQNQSVIFVTAADLLDYLRHTFSPGATFSYEEEFTRVKNVALLVMDDFNLMDSKPWAREKLMQIVDHRYLRRLPTVFTTLHHPASLYDLDARIATRLMDRRLCLPFALQARPYVVRHTHTGRSG